MPMNRREFLATAVASAAVLQQGMTAFAAPGADLQVAIDASKIAGPVNLMIFGGYMEPATTQVWAKMLTDRKFASPITSTLVAAPTNFFFRRFASEPFKPVGAEESVEMDTMRPFVGQHSPASSSMAPSHEGFSSPNCAWVEANLTKAAFTLPAIPAQRFWSVWSGARAPAATATFHVEGTKTLPK